MSFLDKYPQLWSEWEKKQGEWNAWEIRIFVLWSLFLQFLLVQFASLRKCMAGKLVNLFIWSTFLLANWVADFSLGLLCNSGGNSNHSATNNGLVAFWAPFLLLHLGDPGTITAFALEDNELWLRHLLGLVFEFLAATNVFLRSIPHNEFFTPTLLVFVAGLIKYGERTCALYLASTDGIRIPLLKKPDYIKHMEECASKKNSGLSADIEIAQDPERKPRMDLVEDGETNKRKFDDVEAVQSAHEFFITFRGLIVDVIFSFRQRNKSMAFYLKRTAEDAFRVIEIELSFVYDVLYTKAVVIHSRYGYILRAICSSSILLAFFFFFFLDKRHVDKLDKAITYALLIGAMALDALALKMLIFSDWTIVQLQRSPTINLFVSKMGKLTKKFKDKPPPVIYKIILYMVPFQFHEPRWSASIAQYNLIHFCLHDRETFCQKTMDLLQINDLCDEWQYTSYEAVTEELREFMFTELKKKVEIAKDSKTTKHLCSRRGDWALAESVIFLTCILPEVSKSNLMRVFYCGALLLSYAITPMNHPIKAASKQNKPDLKSRLAGACEALLSINTGVELVAERGDRCLSLLFDACILAKELKKLPEGRRWQLMSEVWAEMLAYAAIRCKGHYHAQRLSKGGELITFVWFLMAHMGLGEQFLTDAGQVSANLIVED